MNTPIHFNHNPSDSILFGMNAYDVPELSSAALTEMSIFPGHYTYKANPLACKQQLYENDFYYCDTLVEPSCIVENLRYFDNELANIGELAPLNELHAICANAFNYGRFHRDFNVENAMAEQRYQKWLANLYNDKSIYTLYYANELAGFVGYTNNKLVLHTLDSKYRGKGLAKYFWSKVCKDLYKKGYHEITSSVSAANLAAVNLYASLGFKFKNAVDVYHRVIK